MFSSLPKRALKTYKLVFSIVPPRHTQPHPIQSTYNTTELKSIQDGVFYPDLPLLIPTSREIKILIENMGLPPMEHLKSYDSLREHKKWKVVLRFTECHDKRTRGSNAMHSRNNTILTIEEASSNDWTVKWVREEIGCKDWDNVKDSMNSCQPNVNWNANIQQNVEYFQTLCLYQC